MPPSRTGEAREALVAALAAVARQDRAALRQVYDLTSAKLFGICLRICGDRGSAEDVLQAVYLKIWDRAGQFDAARASPITWLAAIARNSAIDWRRSAAVRGSGAVAGDGGALAVADETRSPISNCLRTKRTPGCTAASANSTRGHRAVFGRRFSTA